MTLNALDCTSWPKSEWCQHCLLFHSVTSLDCPINYLHLVNTLRTDKYLRNIPECVRVCCRLDSVVPALVCELLHRICHDAQQLTSAQVCNRLALRCADDVMNRSVLWYRFHYRHQNSILQKKGRENCNRTLHKCDKMTLTSSETEACTRQC